MIRSPEYQFVYGTLRSSFGGPMHRILARQAEPVGPAWIPGRLYDVGRYPAAVAPAEPEDRVRGEVYALPPSRAAEVLAEMDRYEGYLPDAPDHSLFRRERVQCTAEDGRGYSAWVYLYNRPVQHLPQIRSGDYTAGVEVPSSEPSAHTSRLRLHIQSRNPVPVATKNVSADS